MGLRYRKGVGGGFWGGLSSGGPSAGRKGRRLSWSVGGRGVRGSVRLLPGLSYRFGRKRRR